MEQLTPKPNYVINDNEFIRLAKSGMTVHDLAMHFNVSDSAIKSKLKTYGLNKSAIRKKTIDFTTREAVQNMEHHVSDLEMVISNVTKIACSIRKRIENYEALCEEQSSLIKKVSAGFSKNGKLLIEKKDRKRFGRDCIRAIELTVKVLETDITQELREDAKAYLQYHKYICEYYGALMTAEGIQSMFDALMTEVARESPMCRDRIVRRFKLMHEYIKRNKRPLPLQMNNVTETPKENITSSQNAS